MLTHAHGGLGASIVKSLKAWVAAFQHIHTHSSHWSHIFLFCHNVPHFPHFKKPLTNRQFVISMKAFWSILCVSFVGCFIHYEIPSTEKLKHLGKCALVLIPEYKDIRVYRCHCEWVSVFAAFCSTSSWNQSIRLAEGIVWFFIIYFMWIVCIQSWNKHFTSKW